MTHAPHGVQHLLAALRSTVQQMPDLHGHKSLPRGCNVMQHAEGACPLDPALSE